MNKVVVSLLTKLITPLLRLDCDCEERVANDLLFSYSSAHDAVTLEHVQMIAFLFAMVAAASAQYYGSYVSPYSAGYAAPLAYGGVSSGYYGAGYASPYYGGYYGGYGSYYKK